MQKRLERKKIAIQKALTKSGERNDFKKNIDSLSEVEIKERHDDKKRSEKLGIKIPS